MNTLTGIFKVLAACVVAYVFVVFCVPFIIAWEISQERMRK